MPRKARNLGVSTILDRRDVTPELVNKVAEAMEILVIQAEFMVNDQLELGRHFLGSMSVLKKAEDNICSKQETKRRRPHFTRWTRRRAPARQVTGPTRLTSAIY